MASDSETAHCYVVSSLRDVLEHINAQRRAQGYPSSESSNQSSDTTASEDDDRGRDLDGALFTIYNGCAEELATCVLRNKDKVSHVIRQLAIILDLESLGAQASQCALFDLDGNRLSGRIGMTIENPDRRLLFSVISACPQQTQPVEVLIFGVSGRILGTMKFAPCTPCRTAKRLLYIELELANQCFDIHGNGGRLRGDLPLETVLDLDNPTLTIIFFSYYSTFGGR